MKFECFACGRTTEWDPIKRGGSVPPGWGHQKIKGKAQLFCNGCFDGIRTSSPYVIDLIKERHKIDVNLDKG